MQFNGREYKPFAGAFNTPEYASTLVARRGAAPIPHRGNKVTTLDAVMELIQDGDTISYPHYYRTGDKGLQMVVEALRRHGKRGIILYGNAFFDNTDPWLIEAFADGILAGLYGNPYRKLGGHIMQGALKPWVSVGTSHGNRVRKLQTGEVHIKVAFGPVAMADRFGNASGCMGKPEHYCGPLGLFLADTEYADYTCLLAGTVADKTIGPASLSMENVDFVVPVETPGLAEAIGSGTLDLERIRANKFNSVVAANVTRVMQAADVIQPGMDFQVGSGAGLIVLDNIRSMLRERGIRANLSIGGITSLHQDMFDEGLVDKLMHGQLFEPSERVVGSLLNDARHIDISAGYYASVAVKECLVNQLDVAVLSALEIDREFNVNTVCANGRIIGGIGGGQDVAAGADLTIMFLPLATGKDGKGFPKIVDQVYTRTTPGEVIDVVVTEEYAAVNPASASSRRQAVIDNAEKAGLKLVSMEELHEKSIAKASEFGTLPVRQETTDEVLHLIEWRDGTVLDMIKKPVPKK